ncbi:trp operon leader peptide [Streptomyces sp. NPDC087901]
MGQVDHGGGALKRGQRDHGDAGAAGDGSGTLRHRRAETDRTGVPGTAEGRRRPEPATHRSGLLGPSPGTGPGKGARERPAGNRRPVARKGPLRVPVMSYGSGMFAHSTRNWWWTAHPAAH